MTAEQAAYEVGFEAGAQDGWNAFDQIANGQSCPDEVTSLGTLVCRLPIGHEPPHSTLGAGVLIRSTPSRFCVHCGQSWDNGLGACGCQELRTFRRYVMLAAELVRQHRMHCGPREGDPWDGDLWMGEASALLAQIAGRP